MRIQGRLHFFKLMWIYYYYTYPSFWPEYLRFYFVLKYRIDQSQFLCLKSPSFANNWLKLDENEKIQYHNHCKSYADDLPLILTETFTVFEIFDHITIKIVRILLIFSQFQSFFAKLGCFRHKNWLYILILILIKKLLATLPALSWATPHYIQYILFTPHR